MTWFDVLSAPLMPGPSGPGLLAMAAPADGAASIWVQLVPFAMILGIFYFVILLPMRRRQKKVQSFQDALKVGDKVITTSGIYGSVTKVNDNSVQLQIAEKVRIEVAKAAVGGYQGQEPVVQEQAGL
jgi:preprotein translocase subunit YajC